MDPDFSAPMSAKTATFFLPASSMSPVSLWMHPAPQITVSGTLMEYSFRI